MSYYLDNLTKAIFQLSSGIDWHYVLKIRKRCPIEIVVHKESQCLVLLKMANRDGCRPSTQDCNVPYDRR